MIHARLRQIRAELFEQIQASQGRAFVSDAGDACGSLGELRAMVQCQLEATGDSARILRNTLRRLDRLERADAEGRDDG